MVQKNVMKDITFTAPTLDDVDTLWRWGEENWELWGDEEGKWFRKSSLSRWISDPEDDVLLVAKKDGKLIGMCMTYHLRHWGFCVGLFVDELYRGKGLGKKMLNKAHDLLKKKGIDSMILLVDTKNERGKEF